MHKNTKERYIFPLVVTCLLLVTIACGISSAQVQTAEPTITPTVIETQIPTETTPPTETSVIESPAVPSPTFVPVVTTTYDPASVPIYYPLEDCAASRLYVGDKAFVTFEGGPNGIRYGNDLHEDNIIGYAQPGETLEILEGPFCSYGWIVWFVQTEEGLEGYTPEGSGEKYWLLPHQ